jgi:hypothetical protein
MSDDENTPQVTGREVTQVSGQETEPEETGAEETETEDTGDEGTWVPEESGEERDDAGDAGAQQTDTDDHVGMAPCPACGAEPVDHDAESGSVDDHMTGRGLWQVQCQSCGLSSPRARTRMEARQRWIDLSAD